MPDNFGVPPSKSEIAARLREAVRVAGGNLAVAEKSGVPIGTLNNYLRAVSEPKAIALAQIAKACDASLDWIINGPTDVPSIPPPEYLNSFTYKVLSNREQCLIRQATFRISAGVGALVVDEDKFVPFSEGVLDGLGLRPEDALLLVAEGDSMVPTIADGDPLLVDVSEAARERVIDDKIYVFTVGNEGFVKRLRREPGRIVMVSDNRDRFPEREVPTGEHFALVGRVRWAGRSF